MLTFYMICFYTSCPDTQSSRWNGAVSIGTKKASVWPYRLLSPAITALTKATPAVQIVVWYAKRRAQKCVQRTAVLRDILLTPPRPQSTQHAPPLNPQRPSRVVTAREISPSLQLAPTRPVRERSPTPQTCPARRGRERCFGKKASP